ncbi:MAG: cytochrome c biogenesis heme-transporting ATPase CcmA [Burkholderiales bacterium]|nr:cytochrome c biogenesis heme-transporting ATPase CcmA [Burkholderiales bacterium]
MLSSENLACIRGERLIFSGIEFALDAGEVLVVTGANGSGKTSLLRIVCGLLEAAAGEIRWNGLSARALGDDFFAQLAYLGHQNGLKDDLSATENMQVWAGVSGITVARAAARQALARMGLAGREDLPVRWLSQGQKRRAAIARLLVAERLLWVLDEPFAGLDRASTVTVEALLQEHLADGGMAILTTHQDLGAVAASVRRLELDH